MRIECYHPACQCDIPVLHDQIGNSTNDPVVAMWYLGICPYRFPSGFYEYGPAALIVSISDYYNTELFQWIRHDSTQSLWQFLNELEYKTRATFKRLLNHPMILFKVGSTIYSPQNYEISIKVMGFCNMIAPVSTIVILGILPPLFVLNDEIRSEWMARLYKAIRVMIQHEYYGDMPHFHERYDLWKNQKEISQESID